jgi:hypothetical protein
MSKMASDKARYMAAGIIPGEPYEGELKTMLDMELTPGPNELLTMDQARSAMLVTSGREDLCHRVWHMCEDALKAKIARGELIINPDYVNPCPNPT